MRSEGVRRRRSRGRELAWASGATWGQPDRWVQEWKSREEARGVKTELRESHGEESVLINIALITGKDDSHPKRNVCSPPLLTAGSEASVRYQVLFCPFAFNF